MTAVLEQPTARACARCGTPLAPRQLRYCSKTCFALDHNGTAEHGSRRRYQAGCRCDPCRATKSASNTASRGRRKAKLAAIEQATAGINTNDQTWRERAACQGSDIDLFVPDNPGPHAVIPAECGWCPVRAECLAYGLATKSIGVWGGQYLRGAWHAKKTTTSSRHGAGR